MTPTRRSGFLPGFALLTLSVSLAGCGQHPRPEPTPTPAPQPQVAAPVAPAQPAKPAMAALHFDNVYFPYGTADLRPEARDLLKKVVDQLLAEPDVKFEIAGHCDERGSDEYNLDLGWKRAYAVRDYLVRMGVATDRLYPVSYGRARPAVTGSGEDAWSKNRRGEMEPKP